MKKIAFWRTVADAYGFLFGDLGRFFLLSGPWLAAIAVAMTVTVQLAAVSVVLAVVVGILVVFPVYTAGFAAFAVAWHRAILRGETPRLALRFGRREWRFLGYSALLGFLVAAPPLLGAAVLGGVVAVIVYALGKLAAVLFVLVPIAWFVSFAYSCRLLLGLPAVAVDEPGPVLGTAWQRGRRNGLRLFFGTLACFVFFYLVQTVLQVALGPPFWLTAAQTAIRAHSLAAVVPSVGELAVALLDVVLNFAQAAITVAFLSFSYRQLADGLGQPLPA